jgi:hypothetical protein
MIATMGLTALRAMVASKRDQADQFIVGQTSSTRIT